MSAPVWIAFVAFVLTLIVFDLVVLHRKSHVISIREALGWTAVYMTLALAFTPVVYLLYEQRGVSPVGTKVATTPGWDAVVQYLTGYIVEQSLSVDNIFVIAMVFSFFRIPREHQHRVLFWGIMGAIILRGVMIGLGAALVQRFDWIMYVFGGLLIISAIKMLRMGEDEVHPDHNLAVRIARRLFPVTTEPSGSHFFVKLADGRTAITSQFLALILVETTDVMFAVDSIPAIFAITSDPFIVFTSNIFAILGLRSLFFAVSGLMGLFRYLKFSLVILLGYIGVKMILSHHYPIDNRISLLVILGILSAGIIASLLVKPQEPLIEEPADAGHGAAPPAGDAPAQRAEV